VTAASCRRRWLQHRAVRPWPADALIDAVPYSGRQVATVLGLTVRSRERWAQHRFTTDEADDAAVRFGLHPSQVWRDWFAPERDPLFEPDPVTERLWWLRDVVAERRRVLAESWGVAV
jgi:hypothetical protein